MDEEFLASLIAGFENGTWPNSDFRHLHHLVIAVHYITVYAVPMDKLRDDIKRYNVNQGGANTEDRGYHETITRFWVETVSRYMASLPPGLSQLEITRRVTGEFAGKRDLFRDYYDFDILESREARAGWVAPNQAPL
jgi:hypothetical protein